MVFMVKKNVKKVKLTSNGDEIFCTSQIFYCKLQSVLFILSNNTLISYIYFVSLLSRLSFSSFNFLSLTQTEDAFGAQNTFSLRFSRFGRRWRDGRGQRAFGWRAKGPGFECHVKAQVPSGSWPGCWRVGALSSPWNRWGSEARDWRPRPQGWPRESLRLIALESEGRGIRALPWRGSRLLAKGPPPAMPHGKRASCEGPRVVGG